MRRFSARRRFNRAKRPATHRAEQAFARYKAEPMGFDATVELITCLHETMGIADRNEQLEMLRAVLKEIKSTWFWAKADAMGRWRLCQSALIALESFPELDPEPIERIRDKAGEEMRTAPEVRRKASSYEELIAQTKEDRAILESKRMETKKRTERREDIFGMISGLAIATIIGFGMACIIGLGALHLKRKMERAQKPPPIQQPVRVQSAPKRPKQSPTASRVTPNDPMVLKAIQKGTRKGALSISQILDAYDFVYRHIEYRNIHDSSEGYPRWPRTTLAPIFEKCNERRCKSVGDCKSMTAVLVSMLEGMGAETRLILVRRHIYLSVLIGHVKNKKEQDKLIRTVSRMILNRYRSIGHPLFHTYETEGIYQIYLTLDPTTGRVPGVVGRGKIIRDYETLQGYGMIPDLM